MSLQEQRDAVGRRSEAAAREAKRPESEFFYLVRTHRERGPGALAKYGPALATHMTELEEQELRSYLDKRLRIMADPRLTAVGTSADLGANTGTVLAAVHARRTKAFATLDTAIATRRAAVAAAAQPKTDEHPVVVALRHKLILNHVAKLDPLFRPIFLQQEIDGGRGWDVLAALASEVGNPYQTLVETTKQSLLDGSDEELQALEAYKGALEYGFTVAEREVLDLARKDGADLSGVRIPASQHVAAEPSDPVARAILAGEPLPSTFS